MSKVDATRMNMQKRLRFRLNLDSYGQLKHRYGLSE